MPVKQMFNGNFPRNSLRTHPSDSRKHINVENGIYKTNSISNVFETKKRNLLFTWDCANVLMFCCPSRSGEALKSSTSLYTAIGFCLFNLHSPVRIVLVLFSVFHFVACKTDLSVSVALSTILIEFALVSIFDYGLDREWMGFSMVNRIGKGEQMIFHWILTMDFHIGWAQIISFHDEIFIH